MDHANLSVDHLLGCDILNRDQIPVISHIQVVANADAPFICLQHQPTFRPYNNNLR